ncbi:MAG: VOC family protein [Candidatus Onthomonas sp.]
MRIVGFNHFQLDSADVERTRRFYESLGGSVTQVMEREGGWKGYHVKIGDNATIEIQPPRLPEQCGGFDGWDHIALEVDDCAQACQAIEAAGGRIEKAPTSNKLGDRPIINGVAYGVDGEKIEVIQLL